MAAGFCGPGSDLDGGTGQADQPVDTDDRRQGPGTQAAALLDVHLVQLA